GDEYYLTGDLFRRIAQRDQEDVVNDSADADVFQQGEHAWHGQGRPHPTPGEADHRVQIPGDKNALLASCPLQDDRVRPVVKTDVYDSDNVQGRVATPQAPNNRN